MTEWLSGRHPVTEALKADRPIEKLVLAEGIKPSSVAHIIRLAKERGVVIERVRRKRLHQLTGGTNHQGVAALTAAHRYSELTDALHAAKLRDEPPLLLMLDGIEDPHNLGSILRTAEAAGVHGVIIPKRRAVGLTATVAKTSAGAVEYVRVVRVTNLVRTMNGLKEEGFWITGADAAAKQPYTEVDYRLPTVLVIGSEGKGISRLVREQCDHLVHLPMKGKVNSLNASVAAALVTYEVLRQRHTRKRP